MPKKPSSRLLSKWRCEALEYENSLHRVKPENLDIDVLKFNELNRRILTLTQELLDLQLVARKVKK